MIKNILREQTQCSFDWAKNLKYWGKTSGWRKGMIKTINRALKDVYSDMWERPTKKHMYSGGVVGYEIAKGSTFGWSILNFFNARWFYLFLDKISLHRYKYRFVIVVTFTCLYIRTILS